MIGQGTPMGQARSPELERERRRGGRLSKGDARISILRAHDVSSRLGPAKRRGTCRAARIRERLAVYRDELPGVVSCRQSQFEHAKGVAVANLAVGLDATEEIVAPAARPDHELANTALGVAVPVGVLWRESFIVVIVAGE